MDYEMVLIEWLDSKGVMGEWELIDELQSMKPCRCRSVGFLLENKKSYKTIVQSIDNGQVLGRMTIPECAIISIKKLKP